MIAKIKKLLNPGKIEIKPILLSILTIIVFLFVWGLFSNSLRNKSIAIQIEKTKKEQGDEAAKALQTCFDANGEDCKVSTLPSPLNVKNAIVSLWIDHKENQIKKEEFEKETKEINIEREKNGEAPIIYTGRPSFIEKIITSLETVFVGVLLAFLLAVPIGIILGLSETTRQSVNILIQVFKPMSPVVWLLLVSMIVNTLMEGVEANKAFIISAVSVALCAMWPTLVNTTIGVSSVDKDYLNVAAVLRLSTFDKIIKIILPSSIPMIFTGLRITVSSAWMVLIAIELLAQSPGLGSFVWEEFQSGALDSNSKIIVAMFVIGIIGYLLDRIMISVQKWVTF
jgi:nitrate/nitrite transport system permease protein